MKKEGDGLISGRLIKNILISVFIILLAFIVLFFYQINKLETQISETQLLLSEEIKIIDDKLAESVKVLEESDALIADVINLQKQDYIKRIQIIENQSAAQIKSIQSQIKSSEDESKKLILQLEKELGQEIQSLNVQSTDFSNIIGTVVQSVVSVITDKSQGSGVFVRREGYIVTNYHVIENANAINVITYDKKVHSASLIATAKIQDLALLKISDESYPLLDLADSDQAQVGEKVIALGNPGGLGFSVTEGIVSALSRIISGNIFIQTDVPINPGNSGGPLVNKKSQVLGINTLKIAEFEGVGFAIPSNIVSQILNDIFSQLDAGQ